MIEYAGSAIRALSMEGRMTLCNMSIEAGARAGMIAPDDVTFRYLKGRRFSPQGAEWDRAVEEWRKLPSDPESEVRSRVGDAGGRPCTVCQLGNQSGHGCTDHCQRAGSGGNNERF